MSRSRFLSVLLGVPFLFLFGVAADQKPPDWSMEATIIEACSCPMFCQCYFNTQPAVHAGDQQHKGHEAGHYCRFNNAFRVNKGHYGEVKLDGAKFWVAGDLGAEFSDMEGEWAVLTFDPAVTKEQREGIKAALGKLYPIKYKSFTVAPDAKMEWHASKDAAHASLDGGKVAEVALKRHPGLTDDPVVMRNLRYFGEDSNDGFIMMPNTVEAYRVGEKAFEYKGTNGFMITTRVASKPK